jgi:hypothetical protein
MKKLNLLFLLFIFPFPAQAQNCALHQEPQHFQLEKTAKVDRICQSPRLIALLRQLAINNGSPIKINFGYRTEKEQIKACMGICGRSSCDGGRCAKKSAHTHGIGVDFETGMSPESTCSLMNQLREKYFGGEGGTGNYGSSISHFELSTEKCNMSNCGKLIGGSSCPRGYFSGRVEAFKLEMQKSGEWEN